MTYYGGRQRYNRRGPTRRRSSLVLRQDFINQLNTGGYQQYQDLEYDDYEAPGWYRDNNTGNFQRRRRYNNRNYNNRKYSKYRKYNNRNYNKKKQKKQVWRK